MDRLISIIAVVFLFAGATFADTNSAPTGAGNDEEPALSCPDFQLGVSLKSAPGIRNR